MSLIIRPEAEEDIAEAYTWYTSRSNELGEGFVKALETCFLDIQDNPLAYPTVYKNFHRYLLQKFPYGIFYLVEEGLLEDGELGETIVVFACFQAKRDPKSLQRRL